MNNIELQCKKYKDKYGIILDKNIGIRSLSIIEWYEYFVNGTPNGSKLYQIPQCFINKEELPKLFKYVIEEKIRKKKKKINKKNKKKKEEKNIPDYNIKN